MLIYGCAQFQAVSGVCTARSSLSTGRLLNFTTSDTENKTQHSNRSSLRSLTHSLTHSHSTQKTVIMKQFNAAPVPVPNAIRTRPISTYDVKCPTLAVTSWVSCL